MTYHQRTNHIIYIFSPSLIPADNEWSFVVNFDGGLAIRFSCNSRATMNEWVECIRHKLGEMGILNPKGNLYSKVPSSPTKLVRNPMSPLPSPPAGSRNSNSSAAPAPAALMSENNGSQSGMILCFAVCHKLGFIPVSSQK